MDKKDLKTCALRVDGRCTGEKYEGQACSRLRPSICEVRAQFYQNIHKVAAAIAGDGDEPLGIGA